MKKILYLLGWILPFFASAAGASSDATVTTDVTAAKSSELLTKFIQKELVNLEPNNTKIDTIFQRMNKTFSTKAWENKFYTSDVREFVGTTVANTAAAVGAVGTALPIVMSAAAYWVVKGDVLMFDTIYGGNDLGKAQDTAGGFFVGIVASKSGTTVNILPVNGYNASGGRYSLPPINGSSTAINVIRIGTAYNQVDASVPPFATFPQPTENNAQRTMKQIEESLFDIDASKEVKWNIADFKMHAMLDLKREREYTLLFGQKGQTYDADGESIYTMDGITNLITKATTLNATPTDAHLNAIAKLVFSGNNGAERRFWFAGSDQMERLASIPTYAKQIEANGTETVLGLKFNKIVTNFGELMVTYVNMLDYAQWGNKGVILDMTKLVKGTRKPLVAEYLKLKESGQKNVKAVLIQETWTNFIQGADEYHAVITNA